MNTTLTTDDLSYLKKFKEQFNALDIVIAYDKPSNTFSWSESEDKGKFYNTYVIEAFISDLINGTHSYHYELYHYQHYQNVVFNVEDFWDSIFTLPEKVSDLLKFRVYQLLNYQKEHFKYLCQYAYSAGDTDLMLAIFKMKKHYPDFIDYYSDYGALDMVVKYHHFLIQKQVDVNIVKESFFNHIKDNQIQISDEVLIMAFLKIFPREKLNQLYQAFNLQVEPTFTHTQENALSILSLSVKQLLRSEFNFYGLNYFFKEYPKHQPNFPKMYALSEHKKTIDIAFESGPHHEEKVKRLFEQLIEKQYSWQSHQEQIIEIMNNIHELVYLEEKLSASNQKTGKQKI